MNRNGKIYSPKTLAEELCVPTRAILRAILRGELKCAKLSAYVFRLEGADVDRWLANLKKP
jgi:hypothetical protein